MPKYVYECRQCERQKEEYRKVDDRDKPAKCECGGRMEKTVALTGPVQFKGPGFTPKFHR